MGAINAAGNAVAQLNTVCVVYVCVLHARTWHSACVEDRGPLGSWGWSWGPWGWAASSSTAESSPARPAFFTIHAKFSVLGNMTENSFWNVFFPFCTACWWEMVFSALVIDYKIKVLINSEKYCCTITNIQPIFNYVKVNKHIHIMSMQIHVALSWEKRGHTWNIWRSLPCSTHKITWEWTVCVQWLSWIHS